MSRKSSMLCKEDVPRYVKKIACRMRPVNEHSYYYKLESKCYVGGEVGFENDIQRLLKWARGWYAIAEVRMRNSYSCIGLTKSQAYSRHYHNYVILEISDPVALRFERDNFYRDEVIYDYKNKHYVWKESNQ